MVVAIQALVAFAVVVTAEDINVTVQLSCSSMRGVARFIINSNNYQLFHSKEVGTALPRRGP